MKCLVSISLLVLLPGISPAEPGGDRYGDPIENGAISRLGTERMRHSSPLSELLYVDDDRLLSAAQDRTICLWSTEDGARLLRVTASSGMVMSAGISPDGATLYAGTRGQSVHLFDVATGAERREVQGAGSHMAMSHDRIASADTESAIKLLDDQFEETLGYQPDDYQPSAVAFSADGSVLRRPPVQPQPQARPRRPRRRGADVGPLALLRHRPGGTPLLHRRRGHPGVHGVLPPTARGCSSAGSAG